jgi:hypothetical protein
MGRFVRGEQGGLWSQAGLTRAKASGVILSIAPWGEIIAARVSLGDAVAVSGIAAIVGPPALLAAETAKRKAPLA